MLILSIRLFVWAICAVLKLIGELWWHDAQRFILPIIYSTAVSIISGCWWLGLTTLPMIGTIVLGYADYGKNDAIARFLWLFMICLIAGLGPVIAGHLQWFIYIPYVVSSGFIGMLVRNIDNRIGAPINGLTIGFPILFIH